MSDLDCEDVDEDIGSVLMICAGYEDGRIDSCLGDSGGPLIRRRGEKIELLGITSFGTGECAVPGEVGVYARVSEYRSWFEEFGVKEGIERPELQQCEDGYQYDEVTDECNDINECLVDTVDCSQRCVNLFGGYQCGCEPGFRLEMDGVTCVPEPTPEPEPTTVPEPRPAPTTTPEPESESECEGAEEDCDSASKPGGSESGEGGCKDGSTNEEGDCDGASTSEEGKAGLLLFLLGWLLLP